jgi:hypothetical protein
VRFKLDENIDVRAGTVLAEAGHDVATVAGQYLGGAVDAVIADAVRSENRILVTLDRGFGDLRWSGGKICRGGGSARGTALPAREGRFVRWLIRFDPLVVGVFDPGSVGAEQEQRPHQRTEAKSEADGHLEAVDGE